MPPSCSSNKTYVGERCHLQCNAGYVPAGEKLAVCTENQVWSTNDALECVPTIENAPPPAQFPVHNIDTNIFFPTAPSLLPPPSLLPLPSITQTRPPPPLHRPHMPRHRPYIKCPRNTTIYLSSGELSKHIILQKPLTNLDFRSIESVPAWAKNLEARLGVGNYEITFRGRDPITGHRARCHTIINVVARSEKPKVYYCTPSTEITLGVGETYKPVYWTEPRFEEGAFVQKSQVIFFVVKFFYFQIFNKIYFRVPVLILVPVCTQFVMRPQMIKD